MSYDTRPVSRAHRSTSAQSYTRTRRLTTATGCGAGTDPRRPEGQPRSTHTETVERGTPSRSAISSTPTRSMGSEAKTTEQPEQRPQETRQLGKFVSRATRATGSDVLSLGQGAHVVVSPSVGFTGLSVTRRYSTVKRVLSAPASACPPCRSRPFVARRASAYLAPGADKLLTHVADQHLWPAQRTFDQEVVVAGGTPAGASAVGASVRKARSAAGRCGEGTKSYLGESLRASLDPKNRTTRHGARS